MVHLGHHYTVFELNHNTDTCLTFRHNQKSINVMKKRALPPALYTTKRRQTFHVRNKYTHPCFGSTDSDYTDWNCRLCSV